MHALVLGLAREAKGENVFLRIETCQSLESKVKILNRSFLLNSAYQLNKQRIE